MPETPSDWLKEGISRAGILGWLEEANALAAKESRGEVDIYRLVGSDKPLSRYVSRTALGQLLGPTANKIEDLIAITGAVSAGDWNASDTYRVRKMLPVQILVYIRRLLDEVEDSVNAQLGVTPKERP